MKKDTLKWFFLMTAAVGLMFSIPEAFLTGVIVALLIHYGEAILTRLDDLDDDLFDRE